MWSISYRNKESHRVKTRRCENCNASHIGYVPDSCRNCGEVFDDYIPEVEMLMGRFHEMVEKEDWVVINSYFTLETSLPKEVIEFLAQYKDKLQIPQDIKCSPCLI